VSHLHEPSVVGLDGLESLLAADQPVIKALHLAAEHRPVGHPARFRGTLRRQPPAQIRQLLLQL
jgi:hypothetical protein